jgi:DNA-binding Lrp family transcriptional regulator
MKAFVLISLNDNVEREMLDKLRDFDQVKHAYILFGEWDLVAEIEIENPDALGTFIIDHLRTDKRIRLTSSLIVAGQ